MRRRTVAPIAPYGPVCVKIISSLSATTAILPPCAADGIVGAKDFSPLQRRYSRRVIQTRVGRYNEVYYAE